MIKFLLFILTMLLTHYTIDYNVGKRWVCDIPNCPEGCKETSEEDTAYNPMERKLRLIDYNGGKRWVCDIPNCPEGCEEILKEISYNSKKRWICDIPNCPEGCREASK